MAWVSDVHVSFRLVDDRLDPVAVAAHLTITPTNAYAKGEMSPPGPVTGTSYLRRTGMWRLESVLPRTTALDDHLRSLLDTLEPHAPVLQSYQAQGYVVEFSCGLLLHRQNEGFELCAATLARVSAMGASLSFDIYAPADDDGSEREPPRKVR